MGAGSSLSRVLAFALASVTVVAVGAVPDPALAAPATSWSYPISPYARGGYAFGTEVGRTCGVARKHVGLDLAARVGQQVRAAANGTIYGTHFESRVGWAMLIEHSVPGEGTVITRHANIVPRSGYGAGRVVSRGEVIGTIYNLGSNTHHHFSIRYGSYDRAAWRGYLPAKACGADPAFPSRFVEPTTFIKIHNDLTPPVTTGTSSRSAWAYAAAWTKGSWNVRFACKDDVSGCVRTVYRVNGGTIRAGSRISLDREGRHAISYRSYDLAGNAERWRGPLVRGIDRTEPSVQIEQRSPTFASGDEVAIGAVASDPLAGSPAVASGVFRVRFTFCEYRPSRSDSCSTVTGVRTDGRWVGRPRVHLSPGTYRVRAVGEDRARNATTTADTVFVVLG